MAKISIIMPTVDVPSGTGRLPLSLEPAIKSVLSGGHDDFELLVGCDGDVKSIREHVASYNDNRIIYKNFPFKGMWGNPQRNELQKIATGDYINYLDHDDEYLPGALKTINEFADLYGGRLLIFKIINLHGEKRWERRGDIRPLMIGGQMIVVPNDGRVPEWTPEEEYSADLNFCKRCFKTYDPFGEESVWVSEVIQQLRPWSVKPVQDYKRDLDQLRTGILDDFFSTGTRRQPQDGLGDAVL